MKLYFLFAALLFRNFPPPPLVYPKVRRNESSVEMLHGVQVYDPYSSLENIDSLEVQVFVKAQNAITLPYLTRNGVRDKIRKSLNGLLKYPVYDPPKKKGKYYFTLESSRDQNQKVLYVHETLDGEQNILVDPGGSSAIADFFPSENGEIIAYILSRRGSDWSTVHFMYVSNGTELPEVLTNTKFTKISWTHDNKGIFYTRYPNLERIDGVKEDSVDGHQKIYYHILGTRQSTDILIVEFSNDPHWFIDCEVSDDGKYLIVYIKEYSTGPVQIHFVTLTNFIIYGYPSIPVLYSVVTNFDAEYYYVTNEGPLFIFRTNRNAPNYRLVGINFYNPAEKAWDYDFLEEDPHHILDWAVAVDRNKLVVSYLTDGRSRLQILKISGKIITTFPVEDGLVRHYAGSKRDTEFFYRLSFILSPCKNFHVDFNEEQILKPVLYKESLISGFNASDFLVEHKSFKGKDGTRIPFLIVHKKNFQPNENTPALLYANGGFSKDFEPENLIFMTHFNGVYAFMSNFDCNQLGEKWYNAERILNKRNVLADFQSVAKFLVINSYTSPSKLTIRGNSLGGLLVAASINQRSELFGAAIIQDGTMDLLRFHKMRNGATGTPEYGNAETDKEIDLKDLLTYSPLHNVRMPGGNVTQYPSTLLVTTDRADQIDPSHSFKFVAELQHVIGGNLRQTNPLLIRVIKDADNGRIIGNGKLTAKQIEELTDILAFIQRAVDLTFVE